MRPRAALGCLGSGLGRVDPAPHRTAPPKAPSGTWTDNADEKLGQVSAASLESGKAGKASSTATGKNRE